MDCRPSRRVTYEKPAGLAGVTHLGYDVFRKAGALGPHEHRGYELVLMVAGRVMWEVEGERFEVRGGQVWKARPGEERHGLGEVMHPCEIFWLVVEPRAAGLKVTAAELAQLVVALDAPARIARAPVDCETTLRTVFRELASGETASARGLLVHAIYAMARAFGEDVRSPGGRIPGEVRAALDVIDRSVAEPPAVPPAVPQLAAEVGLSASRLSALFKEHVGMTPAEYALSRRIDRACELLCDTDRSVTDISFDLGFSSTQHFSAAFKKRLGVSPSIHRDGVRRRT